jgi:hypothetical protein
MSTAVSQRFCQVHYNSKLHVFLTFLLFSFEYGFSSVLLCGHLWQYGANRIFKTLLAPYFWQKFVKYTYKLMKLR